MRGHLSTNCIKSYSIYMKMGLAFRDLQLCSQEDRLTTLLTPTPLVTNCILLSPQLSFSKNGLYSILYALLTDEHPLRLFPHAPSHQVFQIRRGDDVGTLLLVGVSNNSLMVSVSFVDLDQARGEELRVCEVHSRPTSPISKFVKTCYPLPTHPIRVWQIFLLF